MILSNVLTHKAVIYVTALFLCISGPAYAQGASGQIGDITVEITLDKSQDIIQKFNVDLALGGINCENDRVLEKPADLVCCNQALKQAQTGIEKANLKKGAWDTIKGTLEIGKDAIQALLLPELEAIGTALEVADVVTRVFDSVTFADYLKNLGGYGFEKLGEFSMEHWGAGDALDAKLAEEFAKKIWGDGYDAIAKELFRGDELMEMTNLTRTTEWCPMQVYTLFKEVREQKLFQFNVTVFGDCACVFPPQHPMGKFAVKARVVLTPVMTFDKANKTLKIHYKAGRPEYFVEADCNCQKPEYGFRIPDPGGPGGQNVGFLPGSLITYDNSQWCSYVPFTIPPQPPPDDPTDTPVPGPGTTPPVGTPPPDQPEEPKAPVPSPPPSEEPKPPVSAPPEEPEPPVSTPRPPEEPVQPPESKPPEEAPPPTLTIKAKITVVEAGGRTRTGTMKGVLVKLNIGTPPLPIAGNDKVETAPPDAEPLQGVTGDDGLLTLQNGTSIAPGMSTGARQSVEIDATPRESTIVAIQPDASKTDQLNPKSYLNQNLHSYVFNSYPTEAGLIAVLFYPKDLSSQVKNWIQGSSNILFTEINFCRDKQEKTGDPYYASKGSWKQKYDDQWAIKRVGFTQDPSSAWELVQQPKPVVVAVIDTGLDWNHEDISWDQIWKNEKEIPDNAIDDDKNGYVDDVIGWNFAGKNNLPWDDDGHGTFVAGVIAATKGNGLGIAGINPNAKIMVLKALNAFGHTRASFIAEAILYAANNGARVINISVGGKNLTRTEQIAIDYAHKRGAVVIVAAGNEATDLNNYGPSGAKHVIAVAASDLEDKPAGYSNWGAAIAITAPGNDVLSLRARATDLMRDIPDVKYSPGEAYVGSDKRYYRASGTSFAAPIVAGTASLLLSQRPALTKQQVERILLNSATDIDIPGIDQSTGYGLLNATAALIADPNYYITAEISGVNVAMEGNQQLLQIVGTADADHFKKAWIEIGAGENPTKWKRISAESVQVVKQNLLATVPAEEFQGSAVWMIRLIVEHENSNVREARFQLRLE